MSAGGCSTLPKKGRFYNAVDNEDIEVRAIMATDCNGVIGYDNDLIFHSSEDMKFFKEKTTGCAVLMGRKTFESMMSKGLRNRINIVMTHKPGEYREQWLAQGLNQNSPPVHFVSGTTGVLDVMQNAGQRKLWVIGGAKIYSMMMPYCRTVCMTIFRVDAKDSPYELLPPKPDRHKIVTFKDFRWVRKHPGTVLQTGRYPILKEGKFIGAIPFNMMAYSLHISKANQEAKKALEAETRLAQTSGHIFNGGHPEKYRDY